MLAAAPAGVGYIGLAGYAYGVEGYYRFGPFISVALNTAAAFALLAPAILLTLPDLGWRRSFMRTPIALDVFTHLLPFSLVLPFVAGAAVVWGVRIRVYDPLFAPVLLALAAAASGVGLARLAAGSVRQAERLLIKATAARERIEQRQALLLDLADHARAPTSRQALANTAALVARHFKASRVGYGEVDETGEWITVAHEFTDGTVPPALGTRRLADFGPEIIEALRARRTVTVEDIATDTRTQGFDEPYLKTSTRSGVTVPLTQDGQLRATLYVGHTAARAWTPGDVDLLESVAGRIWATVERARAEAALQESEARLRATFEAAPVGIVFAEVPSGRLVYGNAAVEGIFRFPMRFSDSLAAYSEWEAYDAEGRRVQAQEFPLSRTLLTREPAHGDYQFACGDGVLRWISITTAPVRDAAARMVGAIVVCADVDDARRVEALLARGKAELEALVEERTRDLQQTQMRLAHVQRMEALGQLAGGIAHDFNNVLQAVQGGAALIERRPADPERVRRLARMMFEAAERGSAITRRLLAFSRRGDLRTEAMSAFLLLTGMREILTHTLGAGIGVRVDAAVCLPMLLADKGQLETVLVNLAANARDAMSGSGLLTLAAAVEVMRPNDEPDRSTTLKPGCYIRLSVTDTGVGMSPEVLARVTEPFFTTKEQGKGTGLGLAMARGFAEQSGGALLVESALGCGTTVKLWFPIAGRATPAAPSSSSDAVAGQRGTKARLLVVDDDAIVREILTHELEAAGYEVASAADGPTALGLLDIGEAVDLVVSDLSMPNMDGVTFIREVQRRRPRLPAILLTGFATNAAEIAVGGTVSGAFTLLRKPIEGTVLAERVAVLLEGLAGGDG